MSYANNSSGYGCSCGYAGGGVSPDATYQQTARKRIRFLGCTCGGGACRGTCRTPISDD